MAGCVPSRNWRTWTYNTYKLASTCSAKKGSVVAQDGHADIVEYTSIQSSIVGIIMHDSVNSLPTGQCVVAVPDYAGTFWADVPTGLALSALSVGQSYGICRNPTTPDACPCSYITTLHTSIWSQVVSVVGPINSANSRIEVQFAANNMAIYSTSSYTRN